jgi:CRP-like cAMP-binding protein
MARRVPLSKSNPPSDDGVRPDRTNRVLGCLPAAERARLAPQLERVELQFDDVIYGFGDTIDRLYFPETAVASLTLTMEDGRTIEVGTTGNDGFVGIPVFLGGDVSPSTVICQISGSAQMMAADAFRRELKHGDAFRAAIGAASNAFTVQAMHSAACNRLHSVEERMARWLLMTQDRVGLERFPLTQQFLSYMLGVYRPSVTVIALGLQKAGLIEYQRGAVRIVDRAGLEEVACECYATVRSVTDELLDRVRCSRSGKVA